MKISPSEPGVIVSGVVHAALLAMTLVAFSDTAKFEDAQESVPVEVLTDQQFNQVMRGARDAKPQQKPTVQADRSADVEDRKPPAQQESKVDVPTPPPPLKRLPDPGQDDQPPTPPARTAALPPPEPPKAEPPRPPVRPVEAPKAETPPEPPKPDAEAIEPPRRPKDEPKKVETPTPPVRPKPKPEEKPLDKQALAKLLAEDPPKPASRPRSGDETSTTKTTLDTDAVAKLLSHETPGQRPSSARDASKLASLGTPTATSARMSPSMWGQLDGLLQDQYKQCWSYLGLGEAQRYIPQIKVEYASDGSLVGQPQLLNSPSDPSLRTLADSALRAVRRCNPLKIPPQFMPYFDQWKARILRFDPEEMAG